MSKEKKIQYGKNHQVVFADHLVRFGVGPQVSKLDFGVIDDIDQSKIDISTTITIPTSHLFDIIKKINNQLNEDAVKQDVVKKLNGIINEINKK
ncbi:hypothetical protein NY598_20595 [Enterobacter hormaechei]|uniref:hypothetical protein n=1 Tax=Enterobacter cloacae complex TaxID=354276 RepID=UPI0003BECB63|nr:MULTISPECIES: hypothetical protein [Enterobacter cloacae complex]ESN06203.1 hypothetical protein L372_04317 [Enterobacter sp. MGH 26]MDA4756672.1 hypothetical protein [Enterobacter hormaechei]